jgi:hypothetical protein
MIISHKNKFIFIHVPKTGGTSIVRALYPYLDMSQDVVMGGHPDHEDKKDVQRIKSGEIHKHSTSQEIKNFVGEEMWDDYFIFSFVRNPYDRIVSTYEWWKQTKWPGDQRKKKEISDMSFKEYTMSDYMGHAMLDYLSYVKRKKYHSDYARVMDIDFLGRLEDPWASFAYICGVLNLPKLELGNYNKSLKKVNPYESYYDEESVSNVENKFREDIKYFNYHFDHEKMDSLLEDGAMEIPNIEDGAIDLKDLDEKNTE